MNSIDIIKESSTFIKKRIKTILLYLFAFYVPLFVLDYFLNNILSYKMIAIYTPPLSGNTFSLLFSIFYLVFAIYFFNNVYYKSGNISKKKIFKFLLQVFLPYQIFIVVLKFIPTLIVGKEYIPAALYYIITTIDMIGLIYISITGFYIITLFDVDNLDFIKIWKRSTQLVKENFDTTIVLAIILGLISWIWGIINSLLSTLVKTNVLLIEFGIDTLRHIFFLILLSIFSGLILTFTTYSKLILVNKNFEKNDI